jgi:DNA-binding response OmpR family regulator
VSRPCILIVDNHPEDLRLLEVSLKNAGFAVTTAANGHDALRKVEISPPDLILSETALPELDGFAFLKALKEKPDWAGIPFLFLSEERSVEHKVRGLEQGVEDYLVKPVFVKELVARLRLIVQRKKRESLEGRGAKTKFSGSLDDIGLVDLIQTVDLSKKTGALHLTRDSERGVIYFQDGEMADAEVGRHRGVAAVYRLLTWSEGYFDVDFRPVRRSRTIHLATQEILMEGMRRLDEWGRLIEQLPPLDTVFMVDAGELIGRLDEIPDEVNAIIRLTDGTRTLLEIIDAAPFDDLETLKIITRLSFYGIFIETGRKGAPPPRTDFAYAKEVSEDERPVEEPSLDDSEISGGLAEQAQVAASSAVPAVVDELPDEPRTSVPALAPEEPPATAAAPAPVAPEPPAPPVAPAAPTPAAPKPFLPAPFLPPPFVPPAREPKLEPPAAAPAEASAAELPVEPAVAPVEPPAAELPVEPAVAPVEPPVEAVPVEPPAAPVEPPAAAAEPPAPPPAPPRGPMPLAFQLPPLPAAPATSPAAEPPVAAPVVAEPPPAAPAEPVAAVAPSASEVPAAPAPATSSLRLDEKKPSTLRLLGGVERVPSWSTLPAAPTLSSTPPAQPGTDAPPPGEALPTRPDGDRKLGAPTTLRMGPAYKRSVPPEAERKRLPTPEQLDAIAAQLESRSPFSSGGMSVPPAPPSFRLAAGETPPPGAMRREEVLAEEAAARRAAEEAVLAEPQPTAPEEEITKVDVVFGETEPKVIVDIPGPSRPPPESGRPRPVSLSPSAHGSGSMVWVVLIALCVLAGGIYLLVRNRGGSTQGRGSDAQLAQAADHAAPVDAGGVLPPDQPDAWGLEPDTALPPEEAFAPEPDGWGLEPDVVAGPETAPPVEPDAGTPPVEPDAALPPPVEDVPPPPPADVAECGDLVKAARDLWRQRDRVGAFGQLRAAMACDPAGIDAALQWGRWVSDNGNLFNDQAACAAGAQAIGPFADAHPNHGELWFHYTNLLYGSGDREAGDAAKERCLAIRPRNEYSASCRYLPQ